MQKKIRNRLLLPSRQGHNCSFYNCWWVHVCFRAFLFLLVFLFLFLLTWELWIFTYAPCCSRRIIPSARDPSCLFRYAFAQHCREVKALRPSTVLDYAVWGTGSPICFVRDRRMCGAHSSPLLGGIERHLYHVSLPLGTLSEREVQFWIRFETMANW